MTLDQNSIHATLRLYTTKGIGLRGINRVISRVIERGDQLSSLLELSPHELTERFSINPDSAERFMSDNQMVHDFQEQLDEQGVSIYLKGMTEYPEHLLAALGNDAPPVLFVRGNLSILSKPAVGFCGSRKASEKGIAVTSECAEDLAKQNFNVISGYASGVDMAAHIAALKSGGITTIVLAEGILNFQVKISVRDLLNPENHLVISSFSPKLPWKAHQAMDRNHVICGLSNSMVVVESGDTGGTFAAGKTALKLKRPLFVVDFESPAISASGNQYFIKHGAFPLRKKREGGPNLSKLIEITKLEFDRGNSIAQQQLNI